MQLKNFGMFKLRINYVDKQSLSSQNKYFILQQHQEQYLWLMFANKKEEDYFCNTERGQCD